MEFLLNALLVLTMAMSVGIIGYMLYETGKINGRLEEIRKFNKLAEKFEEATERAIAKIKELRVQKAELEAKLEIAMKKK